MGKVYIARGAGLYKFGNSENPDERLKQLQTGSPVPLELVYTFDARTPKRAETELKRMFASKHSHGEWFKLNESDVLEVKQATTDVPTTAPSVPQQPAGAATGALKAVHDLWAYRYYLVVFYIVAVPALLWLQSTHDLPQGYVETGQGPTAYAVESGAAALSVPTEAPLGSGPDPVTPVPVTAPPVPDATPAELTAIN